MQYIAEGAFQFLATKTPATVEDAVQLCRTVQDVSSSRGPMGKPIGAATDRGRQAAHSSMMDIPPRNVVAVDTDGNIVHAVVDIGAVSPVTSLPFCSHAICGRYT